MDLLDKIVVTKAAPVDENDFVDLRLLTKLHNAILDEWINQSHELFSVFVHVMDKADDYDGGEWKVEEWKPC